MGVPCSSVLSTFDDDDYYEKSGMEWEKTNKFLS